MSRRRYYTPQEVSLHNRPWDLWVSYLGRVYDLSPLAKAHRGDLLMKPILEAAGKDISHWFNSKTKDVSKWLPSIPEAATSLLLTRNPCVNRWPSFPGSNPLPPTPPREPRGSWLPAPPVLIHCPPIPSQRTQEPWLPAPPSLTH
uniref:Cytochrome b5 domain-containing protein 1 n=1 Tax=Sphenodon punctatus TaxID=8508 RepID=A0A8D0HAR4_SPHPU